MTDIPGGTPPFGSFPGFPGFSQQDMMEKMWDLMRLNPFAAAAIPGGAQGMGPSLSMMSDMLAPLASIEDVPVILEIGGLPASGGPGFDTDESLRDSKGRLTRLLSESPQG